ncbi:Cytochrome c [Gammaproteobacteria bacterium]
MKYTNPKCIAKILFSSLFIAIVPPLWADSSAEDAADKREELMKDMGGHMKAIKKILAGATDTGIVTEHANSIATLTSTLATDLKTLFPVDSNQGDSEAKPTIWQNWAEFEKIAQSAAAKGTALQKTVTEGNSTAIIAAYKELGETCKSCHKDYRIEK